MAHTIDCVCAENVKSWGFPFTFQAYILPHTLNCMCVTAQTHKSIHCWKKKRDFRIIRTKVGGLVTRSVAVNEYFVC